MINKFTREIYRKDYIKARGLYISAYPMSHPINEMAMRMKKYSRKLWFKSVKWEKQND